MAKRTRFVRQLEYRDPRGYTYAEVDLDLLIPNRENPRIAIQESVLDTILALLKEDPNGLYNLARDLVAMRGTNPAELLNVTPSGGSFVVKEGNRRVAARKILRNPEQLRSHVSDAEFQRWAVLARSPAARALPTTALVVIGTDHEPWVDRRHLGPQSGIGVASWNTQAKARRQERRQGVRHRTLALLDALKTEFPDRFGALDPPRRTFTTFERVLDSQDARAHIGIDVDAQGNVVLTRGEHSLRLLERILGDLRRSGKEKLTSRRLHDTPKILQYLGEIEGNDDDADETSLTLGATGSPKSASKPARAHTGRKTDILRSIRVPNAHRLKQIYEELGRVRKVNAPNAAIILVRVLLELSSDHYAKEQNLAFAGDTNPELEQDLKTFWKVLSQAGIITPRSIRDLLNYGATRPLGLGKKLEAVIKGLTEQKAIDPRESGAKIRELRTKEVVPLLNDAVHRLEHSPSMDRVDNILEIVRPVLNAMTPES